MAKVMINIEDGENGSVDLSIAGDFERDINKCSSAQKLTLEALAFMLRNAKAEECGESCDGCAGCGPDADAAKLAEPEDKDEAE